MKTHHTPRLIRAGFSMIEMLIAITISASILTATLVAFDGMIRVYNTTTDSASNHVVARIATNRMLGMIRTGSDFGPFPADVFDINANPLTADYFEFASQTDPDTGEILEITRIELRFPTIGAQYRTWNQFEDPPAVEGAGAGPSELWAVVFDMDGVTDIDDADSQEFLLLSDVRSSAFTLEYDAGPKLMKATIDITFEPTLADDENVWTPSTPESVRLVASAVPRQSVD